MLSKARISESFADTGFCEKAFVYKAMVTGSYH
jgi:hypothetical protein